MDIKKLRADFTFLQNQVHGYQISYLDSAATSQKPKQVIDAISEFYIKYTAPVHRAIYTTGEIATELYEQARKTIGKFIGAQAHETIFTSGTTSGINAIARWASSMLNPGDEIVLTELEHHANLIPWQEVARETGAQLKFIPITSDGDLDYSALDKIISAKTKFVAATYISNAIGTKVNVDLIIERAQAVGAYTLIDAAQAAPHQKIDVKKLNGDFLVFSGHKMLGPTGIGVLYIHERLHEQVTPWYYGGGMILSADYCTATWRPAPHKFEAGTPPIAQAIGLAAAVKYLQEQVDFAVLQKYEAALCEQLIEGLSGIKNIRVLGPIDQLKTQGHLVSFNSTAVHPHDIAAYLDQYGICVRAGNHCAQPLHKKLGAAASVRVSFYLYNTPEDVDKLIAILKRV